MEIKGINILFNKEHNRDYKSPIASNDKLQGNLLLSKNIDATVGNIEFTVPVLNLPKDTQIKIKQLVRELERYLNNEREKNVDEQN